MKILVICQHYAPEPFRVSDICEALVKRGHEVTVVTGVPNYPEGEIYKGYENREHRDEILNGVHVYRTDTHPRKSGAVHRFLNYYSFSRSSTKFVKTLPDNYDVVFVNQLSPVMMAQAGQKYAEMYHKPCVLYCLDLWPESLIAGGITKGSSIYRYYHRVSEKIYRSVDRILITSRSFSNYFEKEFEIDKTKVEYLPQYAEKLFDDIPQKESGDIVELMFAGNIGAAQSVITIMKAAELLKNEPVRFHIVGAGIELEKLQKYADEHQLSNVTFHGRKPIEEMPKYYGMADAMLLTLEADPVLSLTLPGKLQSYMAAGKPVIGAINGEARSVIEASGCGFCGESENEKELAENIRRFVAFEDKATLSENARTYYDHHFFENSFMNKLEFILEQSIS